MYMIEINSNDWQLQEDGEIVVRVQDSFNRPWVFLQNKTQAEDGTYSGHCHYETINYNPASEEENGDLVPVPFIWDADVHLLLPEDESPAEGGTVILNAAEDVQTSEAIQ
jgi:hypothetical protein